MWIFDCNDNSLNSDYIKTLTIESTKQYQLRGYSTDKPYAVVAIVDRRFENEYDKIPIWFYETKEDAVKGLIDLTFKMNGLKK